MIALPQSATRYAPTSYSAVAPASGSSQLLGQGDFTYLGSFRMPASVTYGSDTVSTAYSRGAIAYRGKGGVDRILMCSHNVEGPPNWLGDRVYEVTVPALLTSPPYNIASVYKAWGDPYDGWRYIAGVEDTGTVQIVNGVVTLTGATWPSWAADGNFRYGGTTTFYSVATRDSDTQITLDNTSINASAGTAFEIWGSGSMWTNGLFIDSSDWDTLWWNSFQWYGGGSEPTLGKSTLNDGTEIATGIAQWRVSGVVSQQTGGGCLRMPADFVAANCPGKPFMVGFGGAWMSTVGGASGGPAFFAVPIPDTGTYPNKSSLPKVELMRHARASTPPPGELRARRNSNYQDRVFGICQAGTSTTQIVLQSDAYDTGVYNGNTVSIYEGTGSGQSATMTWVSSLTYSVSPAFGIAPVAGVSKYQLNDGGGGSGAIPGGYWTYADTNPQSTIWVNGNKRGICVVVLYTINRQFYGPGGPHYENYYHRMRVYDPADLARIVAGSIDPWEADPVSEWDMQFPDITYPMGRDGGHLVNVTFDQANRKAYFTDPAGWWDGSESHPVVHVYSIAGSN